MSNPTDEVVWINTIQKRTDKWENLCFEMVEIVEKVPVAVKTSRRRSPADKVAASTVPVPVP